MDRRELEKGSASTEAVIVVPALFLILGLLIAVGSLALGQQAVSTAAHAAARSASLSTSQADASSRVTTAFTSELSQRGMSCRNLAVHIDAGAFNASPGRTGIVRAHITCTVPYAQLIPVPGLPGSKTITVTATSPLDTYRERS